MFIVVFLIQLCYFLSFATHSFNKPNFVLSSMLFQESDRKLVWDDQQMIVSGDGLSFCSDPYEGEIECFWDVTGRGDFVPVAPRQKKKKQISAFNELVLSRDGLFLASADGTLYSRKKRSKPFQKLTSLGPAGRSVAMSATGRTVVIATKQKSISVYHRRRARGGENAYEEADSVVFEKRVMAVALSADGRRLSALTSTRAGDVDAVHFWERGSQKKNKPFHQSAVISLRANADADANDDGGEGWVDRFLHGDKPWSMHAYPRSFKLSPDGTRCVLIARSVPGRFGDFDYWDRWEVGLFYFAHSSSSSTWQLSSIEPIFEDTADAFWAQFSRGVDLAANGRLVWYEPFIERPSRHSRPSRLRVLSTSTDNRKKNRTELLSASRTQWLRGIKPCRGVYGTATAMADSGGRLITTARVTNKNRPKGSNDIKAKGVVFYVYDDLSLWDGCKNNKCDGGASGKRGRGPSGTDVVAQWMPIRQSDAESKCAKRLKKYRKHYVKFLDGDQRYSLQSLHNELNQYRKLCPKFYI